VAWGILNIWMGDFDTIKLKIPPNFQGKNDPDLEWEKKIDCIVISRRRNE
jgi:hypothetical protein